ncbi:Hypothetical predicted protein [Cloeon dipterum]|uniref:Origin recognition complex subunit 1 n=1 Tax=Cloeon dipterum TaxID=197152 RepID=A0A8S1CBZ0_9INSE|nr:Hypothetical predicted protein [Cloeon dipterum]
MDRASRYSHKISQDNPRFEETLSGFEQYGCLQIGSLKIMIGSFIRLRNVKRIKAPGDLSLPPPEFGLVYRIIKTRRDGPLIHVFYFNAYFDQLSEIRRVFPNKEGARKFPPLAEHDVILDRRLPVKHGIIKKENIAGVESMVKIHYQDDPESLLKESKTKYCYRFDLTFSKGFTILVPRVKLTNLEADTYSEEVLTMELLKEQMALIHGHEKVNQHKSESSTAQKNATDTKPVPDHPALDKPKKVKLRKPSNDTDDDLFDDELTSENNADKKAKKVPLRKLREKETTKSKVLRFQERKSARLANLEKYSDIEEEEEDDDTPEFGTSKRESQRVKNAALLLQNTKSLQEAKELFEFVNEEGEDSRGPTNQSDNDKEFVPKRKQSNIKDFLKKVNLDKKSSSVGQDTDEDDVIFNTPKKNKIEKQAEIITPDSTKKSSRRMSVPKTQPMIQEELQESDDSDNVLFNSPRKNQSEKTAQKSGTEQGKAFLDPLKKFNRKIRIVHSDSSSEVNEVPTSEKKRSRRIVTCDSDDEVIVKQVDQPSKSKAQLDKFVSKRAKMPTLMKRKVRAESSSESESGDSHEQEAHKRKRLKNKRRLEIHSILSSDESNSEAKTNKLGPRRKPRMESSILSLKQTWKGKGKVTPSKSRRSAEHGSERSEDMTANEEAAQMETHVIVPIIRPEGAPIGSAVVMKVPKSISDDEFKTPPTSPQIENQSDDDTPDKGNRLKNLCAQPYQSLKNLFGKQQEEYNQVINVPMDSLDGYSQLPDAELNCEENADQNRKGTPEQTSENEASEYELTELDPRKRLTMREKLAEEYRKEYDIDFFLNHSQRSELGRKNSEQQNVDEPYDVLRAGSEDESPTKPVDTREIPCDEEIDTIIPIVESVRKELSIELRDMDNSEVTASEVEDSDTEPRNVIPIILKGKKPPLQADVQETSTPCPSTVPGKKSRKEKLIPKDIDEIRINGRKVKKLLVASPAKDGSLKMRIRSPVKITIPLLQERLNEALNSKPAEETNLSLRGNVPPESPVKPEDPKSPKTLRARGRPPKVASETPSSNKQKASCSAGRLSVAARIETISSEKSKSDAGRTVTRSARQKRSPLRYKDSESSDEEEKEDSPVVHKKRGRPAFKTSVQTPKRKGRGRPQSTVGTPKRGTSTLKRKKLASEKSDIEEQKMPGREDQMANIQDFIESRLEDQTGGCMYISGLPGTGKTASVNQVLLNLLKQRESGEIDFKLLQVSGMELTQPQQIFSRMAEILLESKMTPAIAQTNLAKYFGNKDKKRLSTILVVDELDMLCTRKQDVVYHLFEWPTKATSKLIVLTIANTMDLPERLLQGKVTSRMGLTRLTFRPYTYEQLEKIVQVKLDESGDFDSDARQLVARKVASLSGDARRALEICRRALELAKNTSVQMSHVMKSLKEMLETPTVEAIKNLGPLEKLFLNCMASEIQRTGVEETSLGEVIKSMRSNGLFHGVTDFTDSKISEICARLASCRLVLAEQDRAGLRQRISLNVNPDDLHYALKVSNQI